MRSSAGCSLQGLSGAGRPLEYNLPCNMTTAPPSLSYLHRTPQLSSTMQPCTSSPSELGTRTKIGALRGNGRFSSSWLSVVALRFGECHRGVARIPSAGGSLISAKTVKSTKRAGRASRAGDTPSTSREGESSSPYTDEERWKMAAREVAGVDTSPWDGDDIHGVPGVPHIESELIYGLARVSAVLKARTRSVYGLYVLEGLEENLGRRGKSGKALWILSECERLGITKHIETKHGLDILSEKGPHQGFVIDASPLFNEPKPWRREK